MSADLIAALRRRIAHLEARRLGAAPAPRRARAADPVPLEALAGAHAGRPVRFSSRHRIEPAPAEAARVLGGAAIDPAAALYLDTETTGLSTGAGTFPFLIGYGWFRDGARSGEGEGSEFVIEQLLLRDPDEEEAALAALAERLAACRGLVTFNGRAFDLPLVETRFVLHRMRPPHAHLPHLDLLPPCRRLFRQRLWSCRLGVLEEHVLGARRDDDVPGALIPGLYREYLRSGDAGPLAGVVEHNRLDVLALPRLLLCLARRVSDPLRADGAEELRAIGVMHARDGDPQVAEACLWQSVKVAAHAEPRRRALLSLAALLRRRGDHDGLLAVWQRYAGEFPHDNRGHVEIAKIHEHRRRDFAAAIEAARAAPCRTESVVYRLERLRRRLGVEGPAGDPPESSPRAAGAETDRPRPD